MYYKRYKRKQQLIGIALISPWLIGFVLLKLIPILASLWYSFTDFNLLYPKEKQFIGIENYIDALSNQDVWYMFFRTISYAVISIPAQIVVALLLAHLLQHQQIVGKKIYRALIFLPSIIPGFAVAAVWAGFLDPGTGWLDRLILSPFGFPPYTSSGSEAGQNFYWLLLSVWSIGPIFLILLSAMQTIPKALYEAAKVDGAGPIYRFFRITIPIISPAIFFSVLISLIAVFGGTTLLDRTVPFTTDGQSPMDTAIYIKMFREQDVGGASALAWIMLGLMLWTTYLLFRSADKWVYYADGGEK